MEAYGNNPFQDELDARTDPPVEPTPTAELARLVRTQADNLSDLYTDLAERGVKEAALEQLNIAINAAYTAYDELRPTWWNK